MLMIPCYVGLDYHDETIRVCVVAEDGKLIVNRNVPNDPAEVRRLIDFRCLSVQGVAIEACCGSADFASALEAQTGWPVKLAHPAAVRHLKKSREKTDHGDAWLLADLLRVNYLPEVWLADHATRQLRRLVCYRQGLVAERKNVKLRIRALLREERLFVQHSCRPWTKLWLAWISTLPLGPESRWVLQEELRRLRELDEAVKRVEQRFAEATSGDPVVAKLLEKQSVGLVTAVIIRAMVGRFDRFRSGKQLSRYHGVTPCNASSGKRQADAGLINAGNELLRVVVIQLAQRLPRHDPHWKEFHSRLRKTKPANVATAAVANRWLRRLYHEMVPAKFTSGIEKPDLRSGSANGGPPVAPHPRLSLS
jgi:transposase